MKVQEVLCKSALSPSTLPGLTYSLNPYRGCSHSCVYCYAPNVLRIPYEHWGDIVEVKTNIPLVLAKELKKKKPGIVGISTVTDPYQPLEQTYHLTRYCLEQLVHDDFPTHIQTKSALVIRDIDLLTKFTDSQVMMSIGTIHENERKILEPFTSPIQERLDVLKKCSDAGVKTSVFFGPIYPSTTVAEITCILDSFREAGASEVWIDTLRLKPGIWHNICTNLTQHPGLLTLYSKNVVENNTYYQDIREEILKRGKERNLKIIDAF